jgi:hypothetical protein
MKHLWLSYSHQTIVEAFLTFLTLATNSFTAAVLDLVFINKSKTFPVLVVSSYTAKFQIWPLKT